MQESRPDQKTLTDESKFKLLLQIAEKISATLDLDELLNHLIDSAKSVVEYDAAGIYVIQRVDGQTVIESMVARGYDDNAQHHLMLKFGEGVIGTVVQTGQSILIPNVQLDNRYVEARASTRSEVAAPIAINDRVIGAFNLESDRTGAFSESDLEVLHYFASAAAISIEKAMLHEELVEKKRIESQLEVARQVQASLLPDKPPDVAGYDIDGLNLPTYEVGGDHYDFIKFSDNQLGIAIADVAGKGVPAALIMATFRAALRTQVRNEIALAKILASVNYLLWESTTSTQFVTAFYGILDPSSGRFTYSNAGHNPPLIFRRDGTTEELNRGGPVLGVFEVIAYDETVVVLHTGETLVLYTDGVVEAVSEDGREFGVKRLVETVVESTDLSASKTIRAITDAVRSFTGTDVFHDDFTIVVVKRPFTP